MSNGSDGAPTALRGALPPSPKASTIMSEKPFITAECWVKSAVLFTNPSTRTKRFTLPRSPVAALMVASMHSATRPATACPCATVSSRPSLPDAPGPHSPWPDRNSRLPERAKVK